MTDIFISYSSKDREWVEAFAGLLTAQGYAVWWDNSLLAGNYFHRTISAKLEEAKCVIVVWTEHSVESDWVIAEADRARERRVIVPIQLRDAKLPMPFNRVHTENFRGWRGGVEEKPFQRLRRAVRQYVVVEPVGSVAQPVKPATPVPETSAVQAGIASKLKPKRQRVQAKPSNPLQRFGGKVWAALSAVLVFGLVYALNNTGEVWSWFQDDKSVANVADNGAKTTELPKLLKADKAQQISAVVEPEQMGKVIELDHGMRLVKIPRGRFQMGSENGSSSEKPVHTVNIDYDFWMSETEVTFAQYDAYAVAVGKEKPNDQGWGREQHPVINVSWNDAQGLVQWLSKNNDKGLSCRLPSEAEWEYAARAGTTTKYPWGDEASHKFANYGKDECCDGLVEGEDKWVNTAPVKQFPANKFDLYDMHGNVLEWAQDDWHANYEGAPVDGSAWEGGENRSRVLRGGSWFSTPGVLRSAYRRNSLPGLRVNSFGFRIVCSPPLIR